MENLNIKEEKYYISLTEWEIDIIVQSIKNSNYPGMHVELAYNLMKKINFAIKEVENGNS